MANGNGTSVEIYARLIRDIGFPIAVAGLLLWFLVTRLDPAITELANTIRATMVDFNKVMDKQTRAFEESVEVGRENNERLRQIMGDSPWNRGRRETR